MGLDRRIRVLHCCDGVLADFVVSYLKPEHDAAERGHFSGDGPFLLRFPAELLASDRLKQHASFVGAGIDRD